MSKRPGKRPMRNKGKALTLQQEAFCDEYQRAPSATQAAIRAGYSPASARQLAFKLLRNPIVIAHLAKLAAALKVEEPITKPRAAREVEALAFSDLRDTAAIDADGVVTIVPSAEWAPAAAAAVKKIRQRRREFTNQDGETTATVELEVELHPKLPALEFYSRLQEWVKAGGVGPGEQGGRIYPVPVLLPAWREG